MRPFPDPKPDAFDPDAALQQALDDAINGSTPTPTTVPLAIVAIDDAGPPHAFAGQLESELHYSASMLKVVAMYTAFELRKAANELLADLLPAAADVFSTLRAEFDPIIDANRVRQLDGVNLGSTLLPQYEQIFQVDSPTPTVNFTSGFFGNLFDAIAKAENAGAAACIHALGFGYLTKAMSEAGFLDPDATDDPHTSDSIWLCGDFGFGFPPERIPSVNDGGVAQPGGLAPGGVAQGTSLRQMAKLFTLLSDRNLVGTASDNAMLHLLEEAVRQGHFFLNRDTSVGYVTLNSKLGLGPLKNGTQVASEAAIIRENTTGRFFVAAFQNRQFVNDTASIFPISQIFDTAVASFLFP